MQKNVNCMIARCCFLFFFLFSFTLIFADKVFIRKWLILNLCYITILHSFWFLYILFIFSHVKQPTAEQIRIAKISEISPGSDDPKMREKVVNLMEMTLRTEEDVCFALNECDYDMESAVEFLLESLPVVSICFVIIDCLYEMNWFWSCVHWLTNKRIKKQTKMLIICYFCVYETWYLGCVRNIIQKEKESFSWYWRCRSNWWWMEWEQ